MSNSYFRYKRQRGDYKTARQSRDGASTSKSRGWLRSLVTRVPGKGNSMGKGIPQILTEHLLCAGYWRHSSKQDRQRSLFSPRFYSSREKMVQNLKLKSGGQEMSWIFCLPLQVLSPHFSIGSVLREADPCSLHLPEAPALQLPATSGQ